MFSRASRLSGYVDAAVSDGRGGYYIGGWFTVGRSAGHGLAHVRADGRIDHQWAGENADGDVQIVDALARAGSRLYIGGDFDRVNGRARSNLAAIDTRSGAVTRWQPRADAQVNVLAATGSTVYVGGEFGAVNHKKRDGLAAVTARAGAVTAWHPYRTSLGHTVGALAVSGSTIYVGGDEASGISSRPYVEALTLTMNHPPIWKVNPRGDQYSEDVFALAVSGSRLYVGGEFSRVEGRRRDSLAALDRRTGALTAWDPPAIPSDQDVDVGIYGLSAFGSTLYVGGSFTSIGGRQRTNIAALSTSTGLATPWRPGADQAVNAIAASPRSVYAGGDLSSLGGWERRNLAVLDTRTQSMTSVSLDPNGTVNALGSSGSRVYLGGSFTQMGGLRRGRLAEINTRTGRLTSWDPNANHAVYALATAGSKLYVGGAFTTIAGRSRKRLAALRFSSDRPTAWNPSADRTVRTLAATATRVYAGGRFRHIGSRARRYIAALDPRRGVATSWNPRPRFEGDCNDRFGSAAGCDVGPGVLTVALSRSLVYAGGVFTSIGTRPFGYLAALDPRTGSATSWNPEVGDVTWQLLVKGSTLYAGGGYGLAAFSLQSGRQSVWSPRLDSVSAFDVAGGNAYVGGESSQFGLSNAFEVFRLPSSPA